MEHKTIPFSISVHEGKARIQLDVLEDHDIAIEYLLFQEKVQKIKQRKSMEAMVLHTEGLLDLVKRFKEQYRHVSLKEAKELAQEVLASKKA